MKPNIIRTNQISEFQTVIFCILTALRIASRAMSGLSHLLSGSISEHIAKHACVPVLIVPPDMK
ncbi:MAG: universal stress protein [Daejeonella sp.]